MMKGQELDVQNSLGLSGISVCALGGMVAAGWRLTQRFAWLKVELTVVLVEESDHNLVEESDQTLVEESGQTLVEERNQTSVEENDHAMVEESGHTVVEESDHTLVEMYWERMSGILHMVPWILFFLVNVAGLFLRHCIARGVVADILTVFHKQHCIEG